jgi:phage-related protein
LSKEHRRLVGDDIFTVEIGWPIGMPTCRPMGSGIFEVRTDLPNGTIARVLFCVEDGCMYLLDGFVKKTQKTPQSSLEIAKSRRKEILATPNKEGSCHDGRKE